MIPFQAPHAVIEHAPTAMELADQVDISAASARNYAIWQRAAVMRALASPNGRALGKRGYNHGAAEHLMGDVVNGHEDTPAGIALAQLFRLVAAGASDAVLADCARQLVQHAVDTAVETNVDALSAGYKPPVKFEAQS